MEIIKINVTENDASLTENLNHNIPPDLLLTKEQILDVALRALLVMKSKHQEYLLTRYKDGIDGKWGIFSFAYNFKKEWPVLIEELKALYEKILIENSSDVIKIMRLLKESGQPGNKIMCEWIHCFHVECRRKLIVDRLVELEQVPILTLVGAVAAEFFKIYKQ